MKERLDINTLRNSFFIFLSFQVSQLVQYFVFSGCLIGYFYRKFFGADNIARLFFNQFCVFFSSFIDFFKCSFLNGYSPLIKDNRFN